MIKDLKGNKKREKLIKRNKAGKFHYLNLLVHCICSISYNAGGKE